MSSLVDKYCQTIRTRNISGITSVERMCDVVIEAMSELEEVLQIPMDEQPEEYTEFLADNLHVSRRLFERVEFLLLQQQVRVDAQLVKNQEAENGETD